MDIVDIGNDIAQESTDLLIRRQRELAALPKSPVTGKCYTCSADVKDRRFCDADCRDEYDQRRK